MGKSRTPVERFPPGPLHMSSLGEQWPFPDSAYQQVEHHLHSTSFSCAGLKIAWHPPQQEGRVAFPRLLMEWPSSHSTTDPWLRQIPLIAQFTAALLSQSSLGSPCPRRWRQAMPLKYSWGSLELLPLDTLLVQVVVLLTDVSQEVVCEKLLGRRAAAEQRQTMPRSTLKTHLNGREGPCLLPNSILPSVVPAL